MCEKNKIYSSYPEIYHYTTVCGLAGILASKSIWATDYRELNDAEELKQSRKFIFSWLRRYFENKFKGKYPQSDVCEEAKNIADIITSAYIGDIYICSFCFHDKDYNKENGLLSMWRAYNNQIAIVFDTKCLYENIENKLGKNCIVRLHKVEYFHDKYFPSDKFCSEMKVVKEFSDYFIKEETKKYMDESRSRKLLEVVSTLCNSIKHKGFEEENEIRIVVDRKSPARSGTKRQEGLSLISSKFRNCSIEYIELPLIIESIKKIVVGPGVGRKEMDKLKNIVNKYLNGDQEKISVSDIPFR